jgi:hypothetical protein
MGKKRPIARRLTGETIFEYIFDQWKEANCLLDEIEDTTQHSAALCIGTILLMRLQIPTFFGMPIWSQ